MAKWRSPSITWRWKYEAPSRKTIVERILDAWSQFSKENIIKSFKCFDFSHANDGTEDDFIHCLSVPCKAGIQKLNSQLSILVGKNDALNPFISSSDEEDANEEMNVIKDETNEEIII